MPDYYYQYLNQSELHQVNVDQRQERYQIELDGSHYTVSDVRLVNGQLHFAVDGVQKTAVISQAEQVLFVALDGEIHHLAKVDPRRKQSLLVHQGIENQLQASMPGTVQAVYVAPGDIVELGQPLLVLEAMKMELRLTSPRQATVEAVNVEPAQLVQQGEILVKFVP